MSIPLDEHDAIIPREDPAPLMFEDADGSEHPQNKLIYEALRQYWGQLHSVADIDTEGTLFISLNTTYNDELPWIDIDVAEAIKDRLSLANDNFIQRLLTIKALTRLAEDIAEDVFDYMPEEFDAEKEAANCAEYLNCKMNETKLVLAGMSGVSKSNQNQKINKLTGSYITELIAEIKLMKKADPTGR
jgi:hypothetical protein